jgi:hypothetical protein
MTRFTWTWLRSSSRRTSDSGNNKFSGNFSPQNPHNLALRDKSGFLQDGQHALDSDSGRLADVLILVESYEIGVPVVITM